MIVLFMVSKDDDINQFIPMGIRKFNFWRLSILFYKKCGWLVDCSKAKYEFHVKYSIWLSVWIISHVHLMNVFDGELSSREI